MSATEKFHQSDFNAWWQRSGEWVEEPNQRRGGESGVQLLQLLQPLTPEQPLLYSKRQINHMFVSLRYPFGHPTALREKNAIQGLERLGAKAPKLVFYAAVKKNKDWYALLITEALTDFISLDQWYEQQSVQPFDRAHVEAVLRQIAINFHKMHTGGWQHGCCYAKHIYIKATPALAPEVAFIDLEKANTITCSGLDSYHKTIQIDRLSYAKPYKEITSLL